MDVRELRIGSWVQHEAHADEKWQVDIALLTQINYGNVHVVGIDLTTEILEKLGFTKADNGTGIFYDVYTTPNGLYISMAKGDVGWAFGDKKDKYYMGDSHTEIPSLHWLQNFVYFVHGLELTITL